MKNRWQPPIDEWIPENFSGNTERLTQPYQYSPPINDYVGATSYAPNEGEEMKISVSGFGDLSMKEAKDKILEILKDITAAAESDSISNIEKLEHKLFSSPELNNLVKEYTKHIKLLKSKA